MKNSMKTIIIFTILALIISCSKSENPKITDKPNVSLPMIQTVVAQNTLSSEATFGGTILNNGGGIIMKRGICWGFEDSPSVLLNNFVEDTNNQLGSFEFKVIGRLNPGTFYYVRAYCENEAGLQYGNTINLTTAVDVSILNPSDITSTKAKFKGNINQNGFSYLGFVYGTSPNPTINNNFVNTSISGSYNYDVIVENLIPNTLYYVRGTYPKPEGGFSYTQQKQFKTTGYFGPAGGYVAYDKGEIIDGWRYLEIHPTTLSYDITYTIGGSWGSNQTFISGTYPEFGKGLENTIIIVNNTTQANCAAKLCYNLVLNGYSDWFLASSEELLLISNSLSKANMGIDESWSSTQGSAALAYSTNFVSTQRIYEMSSTLKNYTYNIFPIRRY